MSSLDFAWARACADEAKKLYNMGIDFKAWALLSNEEIEKKLWRFLPYMSEVKVNNLAGYIQLTFGGAFLFVLFWGFIRHLTYVRTLLAFLVCSVITRRFVGVYLRLRLFVDFVLHIMDQLLPWHMTLLNVRVYPLLFL